jgi:hypothetical protein
MVQAPAYFPGCFFTGAKQKTTASTARFSLDTQDTLLAECSQLSTLYPSRGMNGPPFTANEPEIIFL